MTDRLAVDDKNQLKEISISHMPSQPAFVRFCAQFFSYIFHPLFVPLYITLFLVKVHPYGFAGYDDWGKLSNLLQIVVNCTFLPLVSVLLLRGLKFIGSVHLKTQKERIVPYMISMIFYFWNWYAFKNNHGVTEMVSMSMAVFIASVFGFLANISIKVSMHAIGAGSLLAYFILLLFNGKIESGLPLTFAVFIAGITCTSRLIAGRHHPFDIGFGFVMGFLLQLISWWITS